MRTRFRVIFSKHKRLALTALIGPLIFLGAAGPCLAQVRNVDLVKPRLFGYFVGDVLRDEVDVDVDDGTELVEASVPQPGPLSATLELSSRRVETTRSKGLKRYRFHLSYQTFYPALDARQLDVPGFTLSFKSGDHIFPAAVPAWSFGISPLREVLPPPKPSGADYMQPDTLPADYDVRRIAVFGLCLLAATLIVAGLLARHMAWWPFGVRPHRPFTEAARTVRILLADSEALPAYREALVALHRAFDATAGHTVFAEDVPTFLDSHPVFAQLRDQFVAFFASSEGVFFGGKAPATTATLDPTGLRRFSVQLAAAERSEA